MIMVVVGVAVVLVHEILAEDMVGEGMGLLLVLFVGLGHSNLLIAWRHARAAAVLWHVGFTAVKTPAATRVTPAATHRPYASGPAQRFRFIDSAGADGHFASLNPTEWM
jgi:hypothetical protein